MGCIVNVAFLTLGILWCVFPAWGLWPFLGVELLVIWIALGPRGKARRVVDHLQSESPDALAADEWAFMRKYALYFLYPYTARSLSGSMSFTSLLTLGIAVVLLVRQSWLGVAVCVPNYFFVFAPLANSLCPVTFIVSGYQKNPAAWAGEKRQLDRVTAYVTSRLEADRRAADDDADSSTPQ